MIGRKLAHHEITIHLGTGGMGEVCQATDSKLGRRIAIKILPAALASDAERLSRFRPEAQVLASLNHSNIAQIYGLEETGGTYCIVMELVEGETLQARLQRGRVPVDDALAIAKQIGEALDAAHEKGVVHRDLKPGNLMLTTDGKAKVPSNGLGRSGSKNERTGRRSVNGPGRIHKIRPGRMGMAVARRRHLRGDVCLIELDPTRGSEIRKTRPCLVISPDELNQHLRTLVVAPMTPGGNAYPWRIACRFQNRAGVVAVDQIRTIDAERITKRLGHIHPTTLASVLKILQEMFSF